MPKYILPIQMFHPFLNSPNVKAGIVSLTNKLPKQSQVCFTIFNVSPIIKRDQTSRLVLFYLQIRTVIEM